MKLLRRNKGRLSLIRKQPSSWVEKYYERLVDRVTRSSGLLL